MNSSGTAVVAAWCRRRILLLVTMLALGSTSIVIAPAAGAAALGETVPVETVPVDPAPTTLPAPSHESGDETGEGTQPDATSVPASVPATPTDDSPPAVSESELPTDVAPAEPLGALLLGDDLTFGPLAASTLDVAIIAVLPTVDGGTHPTGFVFEYEINYSCNAEPCTGVQITIPFHEIPNSEFGAVHYDVGGPVNLPAVLSGGVLTISAPSLPAGDSLTFSLYVMPRPRVTPDDTSWTLLPTIHADDSDPVTALSGVTKTLDAVLNVLSNKEGPASAIAGEEITYSIFYDCGFSGLYAVVTIVDTLPDGVTFVSASHGGTHDPVTGTVTWVLTGADAHNRCDHEPTPEESGTQLPVHLTVLIDADYVPAGDETRPLLNAATVTFDPVDSSDPSVTHNREANTTVYDPDVYPPGQLIKFNSSGLDPYVGAPLHYQLQLRAPRPLTVAVVDPMPCRAASGTLHVSPASPSTCTDPAFNLTSFNVNRSDAGWTPQIRVVGGTVIDLAPSTGGAQTFTVPAEHVGSVIEVILPPGLPVLGGSVSTTVNFTGTSDLDLAAGHQLRNEATATFTSPAGEQPPVSDQATITLVDGVLLTASKYNDPASGDYRTPYTVNLTSSPSTNAAFEAPMILTDLLPAGHQYSELTPPTLTVNSVSVGVGPEVLVDYAGTGRTLVRFTVPAADLNAAYTAAGGGVRSLAVRASFRVATDEPTPVSPPVINQIQVFYDGHVRGCFQGSLLTADPLDLNGDGRTAGDQHCQGQAGVTRLAPLGSSGLRFAKSARGDLDDAFGAAPAIGRVSATGGHVDYRLRITNIGAAELSDVVVYDVLPYDGDSRGSNFTPTFDSFLDVPANVTVEYSASSNPCRPELGITTACDDDWSATAPATVRALKFVLDGNVTTGNGATVTFRMLTPVLGLNEVAWNNATGTGRRVVSGELLLPVTATASGVGADVAQLAIDKTGPLTVNEGGSISYTVTVRNVGTAPTADTVVTDTLPTELTDVVASDGGVVAGTTVTWAIGELAAGEARAFTVTATVSLPFVGELENRASVTTSTDTAGPTVSEAPCDDDPAAACAVTRVDEVPGRVLINKTGPAVGATGGVVIYTVTATNASPGKTLLDVVVTDVLPAGLTFVEASGGGTYDAGTSTVTWNVGALAFGSSAAFTVTATLDVDSGESVVNRATATASNQTGPPTVPANPCDDDPTWVCVTTTATVPSIIYVKTAEAAEVAAGGEAAFVISVYNFSGVTATDVVVTDILPPGLVDVVATDTTPDVAPIAGVVAADLTSITWDVGTMPNGTSRQFRVTATVAAAAGETLVNAARADSGNADGVVFMFECADDPTWSCAEVLVLPAPPPVPTISKRAVNPVVAPGGEVTFEITLTNPTDEPMTWTLIDLLPAGLTLIDASIDPVPTTVIGSAEIPPEMSEFSAGVLWEGLLVPAGGSLVVSLSATVDADTLGDTFENLSYGGPDGGEWVSTTPCVQTSFAEQLPNPACATVTVLAPLTIAKSVDAEAAAVGDTLVYTITVSNPNPDPIEATIVDFVPTGLTVLEAALDPAGAVVDSAVPAPLDEHYSTVVRWSGVMVPPGDSTFTLAAIVDGDFEADVRIENRASLAPSVGGAPVDVVSASDCEQLPVDEQAVFACAQTDIDAPPPPDATSTTTLVPDATSTTTLVPGASSTTLVPDTTAPDVETTTPSPTTTAPVPSGTLPTTGAATGSAVVAAAALFVAGVAAMLLTRRREV